MDTHPGESQCLVLVVDAKAPCPIFLSNHSKADDQGLLLDRITPLDNIFFMHAPLHSCHPLSSPAGDHGLPDRVPSP